MVYVLLSLCMFWLYYICWLATGGGAVSICSLNCSSMYVSIFYTAEMCLFSFHFFSFPTVVSLSILFSARFSSCLSLQYVCDVTIFGTHMKTKTKTETITSISTLWHLSSSTAAVAATALVVVATFRVSLTVKSSKY